MPLLIQEATIQRILQLSGYILLAVCSLVA